MSDISRPSPSQRWRERAARTAFLLLLLALWAGITRARLLSPLFLPPPEMVWTELASFVPTSAFGLNLLTTIESTLVAFALAIGIGIPLGTLVSRSRLAFDVIEPLLASIFAIPLIIFFPLCVLLFGIGPESKIVFAAVYGFFPVALNTMTGFIHVEPRYVTWSSALGASPWLTFRRVLLPAALAQIVTGLRIGFVVTFASVIAGEMIASLNGIGHEITYNSEIMEPARMFGYIVVAVLLTAVVNLVMSRLSRRDAP